MHRRSWIYVCLPVFHLAYVETARSYYSIRGIPRVKGWRHEDSSVECVSSQCGVACWEKKIESRAANGCLDALIWHFERQTATLLPSHRRVLVLVLVLVVVGGFSGCGGIIASRKGFRRSISRIFPSRIQRSEQFGRKINPIFRAGYFSHLCYAVICVVR